MFLLMLLLSLLASPAQSDTIYQSCENTSNYTTNSTYQSNLATLLSSLYSDGSVPGFYKNTVGSVPDKVYGLVLCRGDQNVTACRSCLDVARQDVIQLCPNNKGANVWYDPCFIRYSNQNFLSSTVNSNPAILVNTQSVAEPDKFNKLVVQLMDMIAQYASYNSSRRFGTGEANFSAANPTIYGLTQCTQDLTGDQCYRCLIDAFNVISSLADKRGLRVLGMRCNFRYDLYPFYEGKSMVLLPSSSPQSNGTNTTTTPTVEEEGNKNNTGIVLGIVIPLVIAFLLICTICICFWRRRRMAKKVPDTSDPEQITSVESILFDLSTLRDATENFSSENKLGQGGFGAVYKGVLYDGRKIAVKRLLTGSGQGFGELKNELVLVAKLQHRNLVRVLGVCLEEQEKMLVYEYVPNRSLDTILFDSIQHEQLDWGRRYKIISGIARGLLYLHEDSQLKIIHRDLKASNILLDEDMNPKISDFGFARLFGGDQTRGTTSRVVGTFGYMAPEYVIRGQYSAKSDIFSFGVLVLEILTGRKNSNFLDTELAEDLLSYAWEHWTQGTIAEILDPSLGNQWPRSEALRCIQIGLLCVQEDPASRPSMSMVVLMLNSYSVSLQAPSKPAFCVGLTGGMDSDALQKGYNFSTGEFDQSLAKSIRMTTNEVSISEMEPR
ncbi:hypothetical protein J5N97_011601 [Dioscorea zingiberensis]|uniref:Cysteine-rich receptor-like protein kinase 10 n=1 Tax=Dioscorea zingiberensis TaxID=325984 RepID=A0A9D5D0V2_9LILI|nr:hypothetical protein J5N97_011601 [Dioscorea zingiberensis]